MTSLLLEKEKEFHKLNDELEKQAKVLMQEVDSVMKMQNSIAIESKQIQNNTKYHENSKNGNKTGSGDKWEKYEENQNSASSGFSKCLKTKITFLQSEMEELKSQYKNKCLEVKQLHADISKLEEEKNKLNQLVILQKDQKEKSANQLTALNSKLQLKELEMATLKKENEKLKKELKSTTANSSNNDTKLNKLIDENERYKLNLRHMKQEEKELRDNHKKQMNDIININKRLEKQVVEFTSGFKKQMMLVQNLKKQKMYLESAKMIQITEEEFSRILDWKPNE